MLDPIIGLILVFVLIMAVIQRRTSGFTDKTVTGSAEYNLPTEDAGLPEVRLHFTPWCGACKSSKPEWEKLKAKYASRVKFTEINEDVAQTDYIQFYPTVIRKDKNGRLTQWSGAVVALDMSGFVEEIFN
jgi:thiol-disulfide isomerase/thioredoxin